MNIDPKAAAAKVAKEMEFALSLLNATKKMRQAIEDNAICTLDPGETKAVIRALQLLSKRPDQ